MAEADLEKDHEGAITYADFNENTRNIRISQNHNQNHDKKSVISVINLIINQLNIPSKSDVKYLTSFANLRRKYLINN